MIRALARTTAAITLAATLFGCGSSSTEPNTHGTVTATTDLQYTPSTITVSRTGGSAQVTWVFQSVMHTVDWNSQPSGAAVSDIDGTSNASVTRTFTEAGTYQYHCDFHNQMTGTVVVE